METTIGVLIGALIAFGGVVYAESRRDKRDRKARETKRHRDSLRQLRDAFLAWDTATDALFSALWKTWIAPHSGSRVRVGPSREQTTDEWLVWFESTRPLIALRSELRNRQLANQIEACQVEANAILQGPTSRSDQDKATFVDRANSCQHLPTQRDGGA